MAFDKSAACAFMFKQLMEANFKPGVDFTFGEKPRCIKSDQCKAWHQANKTELTLGAFTAGMGGQA